MANIVINDIFDELREENNRLFDEIQEISELLNKYRNFSLNLQNICVCFQKSNNDSLIKSLEDEYQRIASHFIKAEEPEENLDQSMNLFGSELLPKILKNKDIDENENIEGNGSYIIDNQNNNPLEDIETNAYQINNKLSKKSKEKITKNKTLKKQICGLCSKDCREYPSTLKILKYGNWYHFYCVRAESVVTPEEKQSLCGLCGKSCNTSKTIDSEKILKCGVWYHTKCCENYHSFNRNSPQNIPFDNNLRTNQNIVSESDSNRVEEKKRKDNKQSIIKTKKLKEVLHKLKKTNETEVNSGTDSKIISEEICLYCGNDCSQVPQHSKNQKKNGQWYHKKCSNNCLMNYWKFDEVRGQRSSQSTTTIEISDDSFNPNKSTDKDDNEDIDESVIDKNKSDGLSISERESETHQKLQNISDKSVIKFNEETECNEGKEANNSYLSGALKSKILFCMYCKKDVSYVSRAQIHQNSEGKWYHNKCYQKLKPQIQQLCIYCQKCVSRVPRLAKCQNSEGQWYHRKCSSRYSNFKGPSTVQLKKLFNQSPCLYCGQDCARNKFKKPSQQQEDGRWYHIICRNFENFSIKQAETLTIQEEEMKLKLKVNMSYILSADNLKDNLTSAQNSNEEKDDKKENEISDVEGGNESQESEEPVTSINILTAEEMIDNQCFDQSVNKVAQVMSSVEDNQNNGIGLESTIDLPEETVSTELKVDSWDWLKLKNRYKYRCNYEGCQRRYESASHRDFHIRRNHTFEKPFKCEECNAEYFRGTDLSLHRLKHLCERNPDLRVKCDFKDCEQLFYNNIRMRRHYKRIHSDKRWVCDWPECGKAYYEKKYWEDHKRLHLGIKEFKCDFKGCNKAFTSNEYLLSHKRIHLKKFVCTWPNCKERFSTKEFLASHMNKHQNIKPFKCSYNGCGKAFYGRPQLFHHNWSFHRLND